MKNLRVSSLFTCLLSFSICTYSQGLFESASNDTSITNNIQSPTKTIDFSGFVKGAIFGGNNNSHDPTIFGSYGQTSLKLNADKNGFGTAFAEVRLNVGNVRGTESVICDVREAWGSFILKGLDVKLGRQIVAWGRADGVNPTNNITPKNELVLSSEFDDARLGNELLQLKTKIGGSTLQVIWVPYYRPDVLLLNSAMIPTGVMIRDPDYPDLKFTNGSYALRYEIIAPSIDGSISYFNGYATFPGFDYALGASGLSLIPKAYRMQVVGGDLSTNIGSFGLRAEVAAKIPYEDKTFIPNPYGQAVLGIDRSIGDCSILVQYSGLYVYNFKKVNDPVLQNQLDPNELLLYGAATAKAEMERMNRLFTNTSEQFSHSITANIQWNAMHEILHLKLSGMYSFTTDEYAVVPSVSYDVADAISLTIGGRYLDGKKETLNYLVSDMMSQIYTELKFSF